MSATGWLPYFFVGSLCLCGSLAMKLSGGLDLNLACTWPRLGFCTHDCIKLWGHFNWCLQAAVLVFDIFAVVWDVSYKLMDELMNIDMAFGGLSIWCMQLVELSFSQDFFRPETKIAVGSC